MFKIMGKYFCEGLKLRAKFYRIWFIDIIKQYLKLDGSILFIRGIGKHIQGQEYLEVYKKLEESQHDL